MRLPSLGLVTRKRMSLVPTLTGDGGICSSDHAVAVALGEEVEDAVDGELVAARPPPRRGVPPVAGGRPERRRQAEVAAFRRRAGGRRLVADEGENLGIGDDAVAVGVGALFLDRIDEGLGEGPPPSAMSGRLAAGCRREHGGVFAEPVGVERRAFGLLRLGLRLDHDRARLGRQRGDAEAAVVAVDLRAGPPETRPE